MTDTLPGDTRPRSLRALRFLQTKYGRDSAKFRTAWKFFKAGYDAALDDFLDATGEQENSNWHNETPALQTFRQKLGLRRQLRL